MPVATMFLSSFIKDGSFSVGNYNLLFNDPRKLFLLLNSLSLGFLTVVIANVIGIPAAFILSRTNLVFKNFIKIGFLLPIFIPPYISALSWGSVLGRNGLMNSLFNVGEFTNSIYNSLFGASFILGISFLPITILFISDSLSSLEKEIEEAALMEASRGKIFFKLTLPLLKPSILSSSILIFILTISEFGVPMLLGVNVFTTEIFTQFSAFYNYDAAIILSMPLTIISFALIYWEYRKLKGVAFVNTESIKNKTAEINLGSWQAKVFIALILLLFVLILLPIIILFFKSLPVNSYTQALIYMEKPVVVSFINSLTGAFILSALGFLAAYFVERRNKKSIDIQLFFYFAIPSTVLGIGLIQLWNRWIFSDFIYNTFIIVQLGYTARFLIISERLFLTAFKQLPVSLEEAAAVEGATQIQIFRKVLIPILKPTFFISFVLGFIFCFGELGTTIVVFPAGQSTLPITLYTIMANSPESVYSAMSIIILFAIISIVTTLFIVQNSFNKKFNQG
ncbi:MAG TPA: iron ABC transporter permease [Bacteroidia bacterium]|nr:iron ABC transporter permease [Bacteroidia bacterium]